MSLADRDFSVDAMRWPQFVSYFEEAWEPGQHVALVGPTGEGKSTTAARLLKMRRYVLALDPKGGDSTLAATGFQRITDWSRGTRRMIEKRIDDNLPVRLIVGPIVKTTEDLAKMRQLHAQVLDHAFEVGGWTVYVDELQVLADRRMMNLGSAVERLLIAARDKKVSVVSSFQAPRNVPRAASDQATWLVVYYTRDVDVVNRLAEMTGRPRSEIRGAVAGLDQHYTLIFNRSPRRPIIVTKARPL